MVPVDKLSHLAKIDCMAATLRLNPNRSEMQAVFPDGDESDVFTECEGMVVVSDDQGNNYLAVLDDSGGLEANTLYQLTPVDTLVEEVDELEEEEEEEEEDPAE